MTANKNTIARLRKVKAEIPNCHIELTNVKGVATFIGRPTREQIAAVNHLAEKALEYLKNKGYDSTTRTGKD